MHFNSWNENQVNIDASKKPSNLATAGSRTAESEEKEHDHFKRTKSELNLQMPYQNEQLDLRISWSATTQQLRIRLSKNITATLSQKI